mgnify:CR=1 FL=1
MREVLLVSLIVGNAPIRCRGIDFSDLLKTVLRKPKFRDHIRGIGNCRTIVPNALMIPRGLHYQLLQL